MSSLQELSSGMDGGELIPGCRTPPTPVLCCDELEHPDVDKQVKEVLCLNSLLDLSIKRQPNIRHDWDLLEQCVQEFGVFTVSESGDVVHQVSRIGVVHDDSDMDDGRHSELCEEQISKETSLSSNPPNCDDGTECSTVVLKSYPSSKTSKRRHVRELFSDNNEKLSDQEQASSPCTSSSDSDFHEESCISSSEEGSFTDDDFIENECNLDEKSGVDVIRSVLKKHRSISRMQREERKKEREAKKAMKDKKLEEYRRKLEHRLDELLNGFASCCSRWCLRELPDEKKDAAR
tara:strand:- start:3164 stop:4036 length:873 start_codon:yes stop_codon:yes gene_type:complete